MSHYLSSLLRATPDLLRVTASLLGRFPQLERVLTAPARLLRRIALPAGLALVSLLTVLIGAPVGASSIPDAAFTTMGCTVSTYRCDDANASMLPDVGVVYPYPDTPLTPMNGIVTTTDVPVAGYQQTDPRFCGDGQVTATGEGYFCAMTGVPAWRSDGVPTGSRTAPYACFPSSDETECRMERNLSPRVTQKPIVPVALAQRSRRRLLRVTAAGIAVTAITFGGAVDTDAVHAFAGTTAKLLTALATIADASSLDAPETGVDRIES